MNGLMPGHRQVDPRGQRRRRVGRAREPDSGTRRAHVVPGRELPAADLADGGDRHGDPGGHQERPPRRRARRPRRDAQRGDAGARRLRRGHLTGQPRRAGHVGQVRCAQLPVRPVRPARPAGPVTRARGATLRPAEHDRRQPPGSPRGSRRRDPAAPPQGHPPRGDHQPVQRERPDQRAAQRRECPPGRRVRPGQRRRHADHREDRQPDKPGTTAAASRPRQPRWRTGTPPRTTPVSSTFLSLLPNVDVAQSLTGSGVRLIATCPTAITGDAFGIDSPASSCAIPIATAAVSTPQTAPQAAPTRPALAVMQVTSDEFRLALREGPQSRYLPQSAEDVSRLLLFVIEYPASR